ncbi:MAG: hypothetical protein V4469_04520 [Patescibacteria group bacterium]
MVEIKAGDKISFIGTDGCTYSDKIIKSDGKTDGFGTSVFTELNGPAWTGRKLLSVNGVKVEDLLVSTPRLKAGEMVRIVSKTDCYLGHPETDLWLEKHFPIRDVSIKEIAYDSMKMNYSYVIQAGDKSYNDWHFAEKDLIPLTKRITRYQIGDILEWNQTSPGIFWRVIHVYGEDNYDIQRLSDLKIVTHHSCGSSRKVEKIAIAGGCGGATIGNNHNGCGGYGSSFSSTNNMTPFNGEEMLKAVKGLESVPFEFAIRSINIKPKKTIMSYLRTISLKLRSALGDAKANQIVAGLRNDDLSLTNAGKTAILEALAESDVYDKALTEEANRLIEEDKKNSAKEE